MLQQTTVATVKGYFHRLIEKWPQLADMAKASLDEVLVVWQGLGYYSRARNLHKTVQQLDQQGFFPQTVQELKQLPGVGEYTAAAVAAIAFNQPVIPVDGNVIRVTARVFGLEEPMPQLKKAVIQRAHLLTSPERAGDFAQALMDLGATVCRPVQPLCEGCPLQSFCQAYAKGLQNHLPTKTPKAFKPTRYGAVFMITNDQGEILFRKRADQGLLAGMVELPGTEWTEEQVALPDFAKNWQRKPKTVKHTFTHFHLELTVYQNKEEDSPVKGFWVNLENLGQYPVPTVIKKVLQCG
jgi:A/G-specific adenine glycosylase